MNSKHKAVLAVLVVSAVVVGIRPAFAQVGCSPSVPWPLVTFCSDSPALASQVNTNFALLAGIVASRTGGLDAGTLALPNGSVVGANLAGSSVSSATIVDGTITASDFSTGAVNGGAIADGTITDADLAPALKCPDNSRTTWGQCIFFRPATGAPYIYNLRGAANACKAEGARLCLIAEVQAAWAAGFEYCAYGWMADGANVGSGNAGFPMQTASSGCGGVGVNLTGSVVSSNAYGAWCCK